MRDKIRTWHRERRAYVYVRQPTAAQVLTNTESTAQQYTLVERARALGWSEDAVDVIDDDLARSGRTVEGGNGFQHLAGGVAARWRVGTDSSIWPADRKFIAPSKAWERGIRCEPMKPFERNPTGESPVRPKP